VLQNEAVFGSKLDEIPRSAMKLYGGLNNESFYFSSKKSACCCGLLMNAARPFLCKCPVMKCTPPRNLRLLSVGGQE